MEYTTWKYQLQVLIKHGLACDFIDLSPSSHRTHPYIVYTKEQGYTISRTSVG